MTVFVIPAAGAGTRFAELFPGIPKPLIPILGRPMIDLVIENTQASEGDSIVVIGRKGSGLSDWKPELDAKVHFSYLEIPELSCGPACTVREALDLIPDGEPVVVLNSDQFVLNGLRGFTEKLKKLEESGLIMTMRASGTRWSYVSIDGEKILSVVEKIEISNEATVGVYGWTTKKLLCMALENGMKASDLVNGEFYIGPTYNYLISSGVPVYRDFLGNLSSAIAGLGTPEDLANALGMHDFISKVSHS